jgi:CheY-like chemotaxis protein
MRSPLSGFSITRVIYQGDKLTRFGRRRDVTRLTPKRYGRGVAPLRSGGTLEGKAPHTKRILVIEDDDAVRYVVADALQDAGFAVALATDGIDALDQIDQHPPDAILLDLAMPAMDGWGFLEACRQDARWAEIPIGLMSAAPKLCKTADQWGVQVAIGKPFALDQLVANVERLVDPLRLAD